MTLSNSSTVICTTVTEYVGILNMYRTNHLQEQLVNNETTKKIMCSSILLGLQTTNRQRKTHSGQPLWSMDS